MHQVTESNGIKEESSVLSKDENEGEKKIQIGCLTILRRVKRRISTA